MIPDLEKLLDGAMIRLNGDRKSHDIVVPAGVIGRVIAHNDSIAVVELIGISAVNGSRLIHPKHGEYQVVWTGR